MRGLASRPPLKRRKAFMFRRTFLSALTGSAVALAMALPVEAQQRVTINVMTAGDQNMVDYITEFLGPQFEKQNPNIRVRAVGTGPGEAGSQKIWERLDAQKKANVAAWDV